jgi:hypothetical protein
MHRISGKTSERDGWLASPSLPPKKTPNGIGLKKEDYVCLAVCKIRKSEITKWIVIEHTSIPIAFCGTQLLPYLVFFGPLCPFFVFVCSLLAPCTVLML